MRNKNGQHKWGTRFDKHESDAKIGDWYRQGQKMQKYEVIQ